MRNEIAGDLGSVNANALKSSMSKIADVAGDACCPGGCKVWVESFDKIVNNKAAMKSYFDLGDTPAKRLAKDKTGDAERSLMRAIALMDESSLEVDGFDKNLRAIITEVLQEAKGMSKQARQCAESAGKADLVVGMEDWITMAAEATWQMISMEHFRRI